MIQAMRLTKTVLISWFLCWHLLASAQEALSGKANNFISAKLLFLDYQGINGGDLALTNGFEVAYRRNINDYLAWTVPLSAGFIDLADELNNRIFFGIEATLRAQYYQPSGRLVPYLYSGAGIVLETTGSTTPQIPLGAGIDVRVGQSSYFNLQAAYRLSSDEQRNNLQLGLGYVYRLGRAPTDTDGDGVPDEADVCPELAGPKRLAGCPDRDGDGVPDQQDLCPDDAGLQSAQGCPDRDSDGVPDQIDNCPDVPGTIDGCPDRDEDGVPDKDDRCPDEKGSLQDGCPLERDRDADGILDSEDDCPDASGSINGCPDRDGDGVADKDDACPDLAGFANGCPEQSPSTSPVSRPPAETEKPNVPIQEATPPTTPSRAETELNDRDNDGFADDIDLCPDKPGALNGCPDMDGDKVPDPLDKCPEVVGRLENDGCPDIRQEDRKTLELAMRAVRFGPGNAILLQESLQILDQIAAIMDRYPAYHLQIIGHTDNTGSADRNQILSEDRAKACYAHLITRGIEPARLSYIGYGPTRPIGNNSTRAGRLLNRRTEFVLFLP